LLEVRWIRPELLEEHKEDRNTELNALKNNKSLKANYFDLIPYIYTMRKKQAKKRPLLPDPRFDDQLVTRFVNMMMWDGKKSVAFGVFYDAMDIVEEKKTDEEKSSLELWKDALSNVMPHVEVRSRRVGGATFQIPMQIRPDRKISTAMKWLISYSRKRNEKGMAQKLAAEVLAASKEEGAAVKKRVDTHKMAEANKAFSHFRF